MEIKLREKISDSLPKGWLPYYIFDIYLNGNEIGNLILREGSYFQRYYDGHVGYEIYPQYRGNNYAYLACKLLFNEAIKLGFHSLIITCDPGNIASKKTIEKLGAKFIEQAKIPLNQRKYFSKEESIKNIYYIERIDNK